MRACVEDVRQEVAHKRMEGPTAYSKKKSMSQQEKDKIVEVLLSQERVLTLLYDKTFPPR